MAKSEIKIKARQLRKSGESIKIIASELGVSPGSVSNWCKDIKLTKSQILALEKRGKDPHYGRRQTYLDKIKALKSDKIEKLYNEGIKQVGTISDRELFVTGVALYWAEGFKKDSQAGMANIDPFLLKFFLMWLNRCFGYQVSDLSFRVALNISHKVRHDEVLNYWSKTLNIPLSQFQKTYFQRTKWKKVYENQNEYFGVLRIKVRKSTDFLRKIKGFIQGLRENSLRN
jgi:hypothetical protein